MLPRQNGVCHLFRRGPAQFPKWGLCHFFTSLQRCGKISLMKHSLLALSLVATILLGGPAAGRAESTPEVDEAASQLVEALANLGVTLTIDAIRATERLAKDHIEGETWHGPAIEPDEYVGGFNVRLYPKGKSRSDEYFKAETFFRLDRHGLKEFEFSTSR